MKTTTFSDIIFSAGEVAMRTRDSLPLVEQTSLQFFTAAQFLEIFNQRAWPELIPALVNVEAASQQFSKNEGSPDELGEILGVYTADPLTCHRRARPVGFFEGDDTVYVDTTCESLWVEFMLPYPGTTWPDLTTMNLATFLAAVCPLRFRNYLMFRAAGMLFGSDGNAVGQAACWKLAEESLTKEIFRLPPVPPWRRAIRLAAPPHHRRRQC